jgi:anti-sigma-K factor RskA
VIVNDDLLAIAYPYALDALADDERRRVDAELASTDDDTRAAFTDEVRAIRETLAAVSEIGAVAPPPRVREQLLDRIAPQVAPTDELAARRRGRWIVMLSVAAAVVVIAVGGVVLGRQLTDTESNPPAITAEQVLRAPDVRSSTAPIPGGGSATVSYSEDANALVLVMDDVPPPPPEANYQMWLLPEAGSPVSAGTMTPDDVQPTTTVVVGEVGTANRLAFTVEPPGGSDAPTSDPFAIVPLA